MIINENKAKISIRDEQGNILIASGLKVRHRKSGYEYTVDSVVKKNGNIYILLNLPDVPRADFESINNYKDDFFDKKQGSNYRLNYKIDRNTMFYKPQSEDDADTIAVPAEEFEKEYEIK
jgi:hypothetical protein